MAPGSDGNKHRQSKTMLFWLPSRASISSRSCFVTPESRPRSKFYLPRFVDVWGYLRTAPYKSQPIPPNNVNPSPVPGVPFESSSCLHVGGDGLASVLLVPFQCHYFGSRAHEDVWSDCVRNRGMTRNYYRNLFSCSSRLRLLDLGFTSARLRSLAIIPYPQNNGLPRRCQASNESFD